MIDIQFFIKSNIQKIKKLFIKQNISEEMQQNINAQENSKQLKQNIAIKKIKKSSINVINNKRFLSLSDNDCALVLHEDGQCEVIFTKFDENNKNFTPNEELLMALTIFLKQKGFGDMLISEFQRVAMNNSKQLFENQKKEN